MATFVYNRPSIVVSFIPHIRAASHLRGLRPILRAPLPKPHYNSQQAKRERRTHNPPARGCARLKVPPWPIGPKEAHRDLAREKERAEE